MALPLDCVPVVGRTVIYKLEYVRNAADIRLVMLEQLMSALSVRGMISEWMTEMININERKRLYSHLHFKRKTFSHAIQRFWPRNP